MSGLQPTGVINCKGPLRESPSAIGWLNLDLTDLQSAKCQPVPLADFDPDLAGAGWELRVAG